jgi:DNA-directed RNA polymerase subunit M/transcription elongation factor TFIIS
MTGSSDSSEMCPVCGNEVQNVERGRVKRIRDVPARIIYQCGECGTIWYTRDLEADPRGQTDADQT